MKTKVKTKTEVLELINKFKKLVDENSIDFKKLGMALKSNIRERQIRDQKDEKIIRDYLEKLERENAIDLKKLADIYSKTPYPDKILI